MNCAATHWFASARIRRASVGANARRCCCRWQFSHSTVLRAKFRYQIYSDARSAAWGESPLMGFEAPTAALAGKKLTLAWVATSAADEAAIAALIPTPAPGQQLDPARCLVVEDTVTGVTAGVAAGATVVGYSPSSVGHSSPEALRAAGAVQVIADMALLPALLA